MPVHVLHAGMDAKEWVCTTHAVQSTGCLCTYPNMQHMHRHPSLHADKRMVDVQIIKAGAP